MLGVVLWSDTNDNKAVIWCEDHGDLAYFSGGAYMPSNMLDFDAGDLVQFDLKEDRHLRLARNPRRIADAAYSELPESLRQAGTAQRAPQRPASPTKRQFSTAKIIPFAKQVVKAATRELAPV